MEACRRLKNSHKKYQHYDKNVIGLNYTQPVEKHKTVQNVMLNSFQHLIKSNYYETLNQVQGDRMRVFKHTGVNLNCSHRYEGLVDYIAGRYVYAAEIGIGHFPDVAFALLKRGVRVFATDIRPFHYSGLKVIVDDIMESDLSAYIALDLIYALRPPSELVPYMVRCARRLSTDLIIKPLSSEYPEGQLIRHGDTTFFLWNNQ